MARRVSEHERQAWVMRFGLNQRKKYTQIISGPEARQLSFCRSDEARRIILGITEKGVVAVQGPVPEELGTHVFAKALAAVTERTTGDSCRVEFKEKRWVVLRWSGSRWVRA